MAFSGYKCLLSALLLLVLIGNGLALKCYDCGKLSAGCNDPFNHEIKDLYKHDCGKDQKLCLKIIHPEEGDAWQRMCGTQDDCDLYKKCYPCTGELCNSSSIVTATTTFVIVAAHGIYRMYI